MASRPARTPCCARARWSTSSRLPARRGNAGFLPSPLVGEGRKNLEGVVMAARRAKGAGRGDQLTIHQGPVVLTTGEGRQIERPGADLVRMLRGEFVPPLCGTALPDGVKFVEWRPPLLLLVHQTPPHVRQL